MKYYVEFRQSNEKDEQGYPMGGRLLGVHVEAEEAYAATDAAVEKLNKMGYWDLYTECCGPASSYEGRENLAPDLMEARRKSIQKVNTEAPNALDIQRVLHLFLSGRKACVVAVKISQRLSLEIPSSIKNKADEYAAKKPNCPVVAQWEKEFATLSLDQVKKYLRQVVASKASCWDVSPEYARRLVLDLKAAIGHETKDQAQ